MLLKGINLRNFRNFHDASFEFNSSLTVIMGKNAQGKTNLLESIFFLLNGSGFRESKEIELLRFESNEHGHVEGIFKEKDDRVTYKIALVKREGSQDAVSKSFFIGKTRRQHYTYAKEQVKAVLFTPQQIEILTGSPDRRREYFNKLLVFYDPQYKKSLDNYEGALRKRNKVLERYEHIPNLDEELSFWNEYLEKEASYITTKRKAYVKFLNNHPKVDNREFEIVYLKNEFSKNRLEEVKTREQILRRTMIGPQKDDFQIFIQNSSKKNVHKFASRSEQRLTILWLKLNEIYYHEEIKKKKPLLLFDDVFSEFDSDNRKRILPLFKAYQTVVTTTEKEIAELTQISKSVILL